MGNTIYFISYFVQIAVFAIIWCYGLKRRRGFVFRLIGSLSVLVGIIFLVGLFESFIVRSNPIVYTIPYALIMVLFGVMMLLCFDVSVDVMLLMLLLPTTAQLCCSAISGFLSYFMSLSEELFFINDLIAIVIICAISMVLSHFFRKIFFYDAGLYKIILVSCYIIVVCIFALNGFRSSIDDTFAKDVLMSGYRFLMSVFVFFVIFSFMYLGRMSYQKSMAEVLLKKEEEHHSVTRELIDLINIKYHDIKHIKNSGEMSEFFERDCKRLDIYGLLVDCGNETLNTVLTEKNVVCNNAGINFSILVDGKALDFMQPVDIYVLFGNALDNAIECISALPKNERHIRLKVRCVRDMVNVECENTCHEKLKFENGLPLTTKEDGYNHGFGTKSIADVCKKYNAEYRMSCDGETYTLSVLMPARKITEKQKSADNAAIPKYI